MPTHPLHCAPSAVPRRLERQGWGLVVSVWVHIAGAVLLVVWPGGERVQRPVAPAGHVMLVSWLGVDQGDAATSSGRPGMGLLDTRADAPSDGAMGPVATEGALADTVADTAPEAGSSEQQRPLEHREPVGEADTTRAREEEPEEQVADDPTVEPLEFVVAEADIPEPEEAPETEVHSSRNRAAHELRRALATPDPLGVHNPRPTGVDSPGGEQVLREAPGEAPDRLGTQSERATEWASGLRGGGGGGERASALSAGGPSQHGDASEGGRAAASARGGAGHQATGAIGAADALAGAPLRELTTPELWRPSVMRWTQPAATGTSGAIRSAASTPTTGERTAVRERPGQRADRGGNDAESETVAHAGPTALVDTRGAGDGDDEGFGDIVNDLREALGWGGIDRSKLAPRRPHFGPALDGSGEQATSRDTLIAQHYDLDEIAFVAAKESPEGHYLEEVTRVINGRWETLDLSVHDRARGIGGSVVVLFRVKRNGRVGDVLVETSSGNLDLDRLALSAVPERLPRFPRDLERDQLVHRMHFRYDNPFIVVDSAPRP